MIPPNQRCRPGHIQCNRHHSQLCTDYWQERERQETALENSQETYGYATEMAEHKGSLITFKKWLIDSASLNGWTHYVC